MLLLMEILSVKSNLATSCKLTKSVFLFCFSSKPFDTYNCYHAWIRLVSHLCCISHFLVQCCAMNGIRGAAVNWKSKMRVNIPAGGAVAEWWVKSTMSDLKLAEWKWSSFEVLWGTGLRHDCKDGWRSSEPEIPKASTEAWASLRPERVGKTIHI